MPSWLVTSSAKTPTLLTAHLSSLGETPNFFDQKRVVVMDVDTFPLTDALGLVVEHGLSEAVPHEIDTASAPPRTLGHGCLQGIRVR